MNGGIFDAMRNLTLAIAADKRYVPEVLSARDAYTSMDEPLWGEIPVRTFPVRGPRIFGYAPRLASALEASNADILHIHSIWMYPSVVARRWAQGTRPYVVSPHGLLKPLALRNSRWKKRIAAFLYENAHLRHSACLHALNTAEAEAFREFGLKNPICVIPNGATLRQDIVSEQPARNKSILYLGRIHPLKGLRNLIQAWAAVQNNPNAAGWRLTIAGSDQNRHRTELEQLASRLGVESSIDFIGPQFGADKKCCLATSSAFILPSESEGQPIGVLEAWSWRLPVLMTPACNLPEGVQAGAAILMNPDSNSIAAALRQLLSMTAEDLESMGLNGERLVKECYQWQRIGKAMADVYDWILERGPKPKCILA
jgi:poly(glycerol-phosphate) alpha-glucosyltransferase